MEEIGKRLKTFRLANGMTLKQLASRAGCTDAYLSQLERGHANPSITTLKKIAQALRVKVVDFFLEPEQEENDVVLSEQERVDINFKQGDAKIQMLVRNIRNKRMQPFYTTIEPGGGSKGSYAHIGEECGIVLRGKLEINLKGKAYVVGKNESFYFSSQKPHSWSNPGKKTTVVIWVVSPPTF
ncbi:MAG: helix-turn-helix domain-containing protein [Deltaproteobacteria bacterium]|nr:MAG: helix-turn-helix domain-containing protein [Deltaproteobacteria bacterium]